MMNKNIYGLLIALLYTSSVLAVTAVSSKKLIQSNKSLKKKKSFGFTLDIAQPMFSDSSIRDQPNDRAIDLTLRSTYEYNLLVGIDQISKNNKSKADLLGVYFGMGKVIEMNKHFEAIIKYRIIGFHARYDGGDMFVGLEAGFRYRVSPTFSLYNSMRTDIARRGYNAEISDSKKLVLNTAFNLGLAANY
jgi:hypothetical protein